VLAIVNLSNTPTNKGALAVPVELRGLPDEVAVIEIAPAMVTVLFAESP
jgi:hypothetical protein